MVDEAPDLDLIPRTVRDKLDRIGIKLHLKEWERLSLSERRQLRDAPCVTAAEIDSYRRQLEDIVFRSSGRMPDKLATTRSA